VALVTDDFRLYHHLAPFLESEGIPVVGLKPDEPVPAAVRVLLGGPPSDARSVPIADDSETMLLAVLQRLDARPTARPSYKRVVFGLDPGRVIGLAVVCDGETLLTAECLSVREATRRLLAWRNGLTGRKWEVHIGDGSPAVGQHLVSELWDVFQGSVVFVPEHATSPQVPVTGSRHADAAVLIALREPQPL
jgi:hypothetical protein